MSNVTVYISHLSDIQ